NFSTIPASTTQCSTSGLLSGHFEYMVPCVQGHSDSSPERDESLQPSRVIDAANIYGSFPAELFQYLRHLLLCPRIVSADHHFNIFELRIDHLLVGDSVETFDDSCGLILVLVALT